MGSTDLLDLVWFLEYSAAALPCWVRNERKISISSLIWSWLGHSLSERNFGISNFSLPPSSHTQMQRICLLGSTNAAWLILFLICPLVLCFERLEATSGRLSFIHSFARFKLASMMDILGCTYQAWKWNSCLKWNGNEVWANNARAGADYDQQEN